MVAELIIAPEAQRDVDEAYSWYKDRRPGLGEEFCCIRERGKFSFFSVNQLLNPKTVEENYEVKR